jgi:hypothetical protein
LQVEVVEAEVEAEVEVEVEALEVVPSFQKSKHWSPPVRTLLNPWKLTLAL